MKKIISVVGARPNFIKIAPIHKAFSKYSAYINHRICHTGQHFDEKMSKIFFEELEMPVPDFYLGVGSATHAVQTAKIMVEFEKVLLEEKPDLIIVPGDVNSTMACSLVASKMGIKIAHIESGLRSFDRTMPEEINRIVTDAISDLLFVSEPSGVKNLRIEGITDDKIFHVGNVMIDSLLYYKQRFDQSTIHRTLGVDSGEYVLVTFHRPANVDDKNGAKELVDFLNNCATFKKVVFPVHPRTQKNLKEFGLMQKFSSDILITEPIGYIDFLALTQKALLVITDSGGIQEETTFLSIPCITVRNNTERPITVDLGTNYLAGTKFDVVAEYVAKILKGEFKKGSIPDFWDGNASKRIADIINNYLLKV